MSRHTDGQIYVLLNSCSHRGSTVCELPSGNTKSFRCPYHSWTYRTNGDLALLPSRDRFGADFDLADYGLTRVARVASYRGFMFASLAEDGPDLDEHLGRAKHYIDIFADRSPMGCVQVTKPLKYEYQGNWKLQMENMSDGYHAQYVHASAFGTSVEPPPNGKSVQSASTWSQLRSGSRDNGLVDTGDHQQQAGESRVFRGTRGTDGRRAR